MNNIKILNETSSETSIQDLMNATQIFGRALGFIFEDREGIVVDVTEDIILDNTKKVLLYKLDNQIHIMRCDEDIPDGTTVKLTDTERNDTENQN